MSAQWWGQPETDLVHWFAWEVHDSGGKEHLSAKAADSVLAALTPTIERVRREAQAEFLRGLIAGWKENIGWAETVGGPMYRQGWEDAIKALEMGLPKHGGSE